MTTISQAIATLERQLRALTYDNGAKVFEHVYAYPAIPDKGQTPCATIEAITSTRVTVTVYLVFSAASISQAEKRTLEIAEICSARWGVQGRFGWITSLGDRYRTFKFELICM